MSKTDGGPAFPHTYDEKNNARTGLTLRDYFAAQVMPAIIANDDRWPCEVDPSTNDDEETELGLAATVAYMIADAMLAERDK